MYSSIFLGVAPGLVTTTVLFNLMPFVIESDRIKECGKTGIKSNG